MAIDPITAGALISAGSSAVSGYMEGLSAEEEEKKRKAEEEEKRKKQAMMAMYQNMYNRPGQMGNVVNSMLPAQQYRDQKTFMQRASGG